MDRADVVNDELVIEWFTTRSLKETTINGYKMGIWSYCNFLNKTPTELIDEAEEEIEAGTLMRKRNVKKYLTGFQNHLSTTGLSNNTQKNYISSILAFYKCFDIAVPNSLLTVKAFPVKSNTKIPDKHGLRYLIKYDIGELEKALVFVGCTSGLSQQDIINMRVESFKEGYDPKTGITTLDMRRGKVEYDHVTFLTPEASDAVWRYIEWRNRTDKFRIYDDRNYLFIKRYFSDSFLETKDDDMRKMGKQGFMYVYREMAKHVDMHAPAGEWNILRSHNVRKWFYSTLINAGCDPMLAEYWMGHNLGQTKTAYLKSKPEMMKNIYRKYAPHLTVAEELDLSESPEYKVMEEQLKVTSVEAAKSVWLNKKLEDQGKTIEELKQMLKEQTEVQGAFMDVISADPGMSKKLDERMKDANPTSKQT